jgi:diguanylate cyclase (GGDEF)-like protein
MIGGSMTNPKGDVKISKEVKELTDLFEIAKTVVSTLDLDKVLESILKSAMDIADAPSGSIALYDSNKNEMTIRAARGFSEAFMSKKCWPVHEGGLTEKVLLHNYPVVISDTDREKYVNNPILKAENIKSLVASPLVYHEKVVGILYIDDVKVREFSKNTLKLLSILASFAAMSIDNAKLHEDTIKLAITDGLTGLYNHRYFQEILEDELARAKRYNLYVSLIFLDIDNFKQFNDKYGHQEGDKVLKVVSKSILKSIRQVDCAARYGGEEFAVIMPENDIESAFIVADRIRKNVIKDSKEFFKSDTKYVTVTLGVASYPLDAIDKEELIKRSDEALYHCKANGKNCTARYDNMENECEDETTDDAIISEFKE